MDKTYSNIIYIPNLVTISTHTKVGSNENLAASIKKKPCQ